MAVFKIAGRRRRFTMVCNDLVNEPTLSAKAKGVMLYLLSKPDNWEVRLSDVVRHFSDGEYAIRGGVEELEVAGYIRRVQNREDDGRFRGYLYWVYEVPVDPDKRTNPEDRKHKTTQVDPDKQAESTVSQFPVNGFPEYGKPQPTNTESTNTESTNTKTDKYGSDEPLPEEDEPEPAPNLGRDLQTQEGRDRALERILSKRRERLEGSPWLDLESLSPTISKYNPPLEVDRAFVLRLVQALQDAGIPLDYKNASEVRYWLKECESLGRKTDWRFDVVERALAKALSANLSIKGPQSIHYAVADELRAKTQAASGQTVAGGDGGMVTVLHRIELPEEDDL